MHALRKVCVQQGVDLPSGASVTGPISMYIAELARDRHCRWVLRILGRRMHMSQE